MSNKQTKKTTSNKKSHHNTKAAGARAARRQLAKRARTTGSSTASADASVARPDPRLPAVGTVIEKRDRHGKLRCKCKVEKNGIRYNGAVYRSLSGAAMAAATDLGLESPTQNGFLFWALN